MKNLKYIVAFSLSFALSGFAKAQQAVAPAQQAPAPVHQVAVPAQPNLNIHRGRRAIIRQHYKALAHELRTEIHRDKRELRHIHRMMKRHNHRARRPLNQIKR